MNCTLGLNLTWQPALPILHIAAAAIVLAALAVAAYRRSMSLRRSASIALLIVRLLVIAGLAVVLMGPSELPPSAQGDSRPLLIVLVDTSASMQTADVEEQSRIGFAMDKWLDPGMLAALERRYDVRYYGFADSAGVLPNAAWNRPADEVADGRVSHIVESLRDTMLANVVLPDNRAAVLLLSDGHDSGEAPLVSVAPLAQARGVTVHTVTLGGQTLQRNLVVEAVPQQEYLIAGEPGMITARVYQGGLPDARATLHMESGDEHVQRQIAFEGRRFVEVELPVKSETPGLQEYRVWVDSVEGETETRDNVHPVFIDVTDKRMRVLIVEGQPYWDTKFIAQSLRKDAAIEVDQITQFAPGRVETIVTRGDEQRRLSLPTTADEWSRYDVVVLGKGLERMLPAASAEALVQYVTQRGGHVIFARGQPYEQGRAESRLLAEAMGAIEPVVWGSGYWHDVKLSLTRQGREAPLFSLPALSLDPDEITQTLPGLAVMTQVASTKTLAIELAEANVAGDGGAMAPGIVLMQPGRGKVLAVLGEGLHRWGLLPPERKRFDGVYDAFWSNAVRWLVMGGAFQPGQQVAMTVRPGTVQLNKSVVIDVTAKYVPEAGFNPSLSVTGPDGKSEQLALQPVAGVASRLRATYVPGQTGVYEAHLNASPLTPAELSRKFSVYDIDVERLETSANPSGMRALAEQTGGVAFKPAQWSEFAGELQRLRAAREVPVQPVFIWDRWWVLGALLLWLGIEWLCRRAAGLL